MFIVVMNHGPFNRSRNAADSGRAMIVAQQTAEPLAAFNLSDYAPLKFNSKAATVLHGTHIIKKEKMVPSKLMETMTISTRMPSAVKNCPVLSGEILQARWR